MFHSNHYRLTTSTSSSNLCFRLSSQSMRKANRIEGRRHTDWVSWWVSKWMSEFEWKTKAKCGWRRFDVGEFCAGGGWSANNTIFNFQSWFFMFTVKGWRKLQETDFTWHSTGSSPVVRVEQGEIGSFYTSKLNEMENSRWELKSTGWSAHTTCKNWVWWEFRQFGARYKGVAKFPTSKRIDMRVLLQLQFMYNFHLKINSHALSTNMNRRKST